MNAFCVYSLFIFFTFMLKWFKKHTEYLLLWWIIVLLIVIVYCPFCPSTRLENNYQRWVCVPRELTSYDFDIFKLEAEKSIDKLWLNSWRVIYTFWESRDWWWRARFIDNSSEESHYAILELNKYWVCGDEPYTEEWIKWLARHEVWHLVVADLVREIKNWQDAEDVYEEEMVAHTIANLLD